jgi:integrase
MPRDSAMKDPGGYIQADDVPKIIAAAKEGRDRLLVNVLAVTGRRVSEVVGPLGIRPCDLDAGDSGPRIAFIILKKGGTVHDRKWKYVPRELVSELVVFCSNTSPQKPIFDKTRQWAFLVVRDAAARAGVCTVSGAQVHPHHFRHSWVARRIENPNMTIDKLFQVREYLEHSDIKVTQSYAHINTKKEKELFDI